MNTTDLNITLRPAAEPDEKFLCDVYRSTRLDEVAAFGWDVSQQDEFLRMQFTIQHRAYRMQYPGAEHSVILLGASMAGRIIVDRTDGWISLTDIAVLPEFRGNGIATYLIMQLQDEASASGKPLLLQVDKSNEDALRLYKDLGFRITGESQFSYKMEWRSSKLT